MTDEDGYNGWSNRATWAMALNLSNDYGVYQACEGAARFASVGNEEYVEGFYAELAEYLRMIAVDYLDSFPSALPDFDPAGHESSDPKDPHGPDDITEVDWQEIAETYELSEYV